MENTLDQNAGQNNGLSGEDKSNLLVSAKWARFLGILGYVAAGLIILVGLFMMFGFGALMSGMSSLSRNRGMEGMDNSGMGGLAAGMGIVFGIVYLLLAVLVFFISRFLHRFGTSIRDGIQNGSSENVSFGFLNLKNYLQLNGIIAAVVLGIYALIFLIGIFAAIAH